MAGEDAPPPSSPSSPVSPSARGSKPRSRRAAAEEAAAPRPPATERELAIAALFAGPQRTFAPEESIALRSQVRYDMNLARSELTSPLHWIICRCSLRMQIRCNALNLPATCHFISADAPTGCPEHEASRPPRPVLGRPKPRHRSGGRTAASSAARP